MQISAEFITSAADARGFPRDRLPEIALIGRSNVGKSSLINALVRQQVARTSAAPGKTRLANFYRVRRGALPAFYLVDLPGYGYARAPRPFDSVEGRGGSRQGRDAATREFGRLNEAYFARGSGIKGPGSEETPRIPNPGSRIPIGVLLLVDARHPGLESDLDAWAWLETQPCARAVVGTKADKLTRAERARHTREFESAFVSPVPLVSARTGEGLDELWKLIARLPSQRTAP